MKIERLQTISTRISGLNFFQWTARQKDRTPSALGVRNSLAGEHGLLGGASGGR